MEAPGAAPYADAIRASVGSSETKANLTQSEGLALMCVGYFQLITRAGLSTFFGKEISCDLIGQLRSAKLIVSGALSPVPGALYTYVTTNEFLLEFGLDTLHGLPDIEALMAGGGMENLQIATGANSEGD